MKTFVLAREEDVSGVSGTGVVAEGVEFSDGSVVLKWTVGEHQSTVIWNSIASVEAIHGHDGRTQVVWLDAGELDPDWMERLGEIADDLWQRGDKATCGALHGLRSQITRNGGRA